jgi:uncharacterized membrane protein (UPF0127 family)
MDHFPPMTVAITRRAVIAALGIAMFVSCAADGGSPAPARTIPLSFATTVLHVELATTVAEREKGLMGRPALPDTAGMLFVFSNPDTLRFWMKDTPVPLSIAFLSADGTIVNIEEMEANTQTIHRSAGLARYALEVRKGWFSDRGIVAGAKATFTLPPGLTIDP